VIEIMVYALLGMAMAEGGLRHQRAHAPASAFYGAYLVLVAFWPAVLILVIIQLIVRAVKS